MTTIQAHSAADADSLAVKMADKAIDIGPQHAAKSYLNAAAILEAAAETGAEAIHPDYGFLSENAAFADAVEAAGLVFVGPRGDTIRTMEPRRRLWRPVRAPDRTGGRACPQRPGLDPRRQGGLRRRLQTPQGL
jgi:acetyl/propionyl-CoA carboxylase alpha subunit